MKNFARSSKDTPVPRLLRLKRKKREQCIAVSILYMTGAPLAGPLLSLPTNSRTSLDGLGPGPGGSVDFRSTPGVVVLHLHRAGTSALVANVGTGAGAVPLSHVGLHLPRGHHPGRPGQVTLGRAGMGRAAQVRGSLVAGQSEVSHRRRRKLIGSAHARGPRVLPLLHAGVHRAGHEAGVHAGVRILDLQRVDQISQRIRGG